MRHEWTAVTIDGFATGEVDFAARLAAIDQRMRDMVDELIMGPLVNAVNGGAVLSIEGHSDRVDTGEDHRTSLALERDASRLRAQNAEATILMMLGRDWIEPPPTSWAAMPYLAVETLYFGATRLSVDPTNEEDRRQNRRVELILCRFISDD
jgi:flagellar motor protein MotB